MIRGFTRLCWSLYTPLVVIWAETVSSSKRHEMICQDNTNRTLTRQFEFNKINQSLNYYTPFWGEYLDAIADARV